MAEEIVKTVKDVDKLFSQIILNGEVHNSERYRGNTRTASSASSRLSDNIEQGEDISAVVLNDVKHDFVDSDTVQALNNEVTERQIADENLQNEINSIKAKIPVQATSDNKLADKNYVNSAVATNTANFLGTYTSLEQIEAIPHPTNNDYAYLETTDTAGNTVYKRYKYSSENDEWLFEYELNNPSFTAEQWATINSGLDSSSIPNAINALDMNEVGGSGKLIQSVAETNGIMRATAVDIANTVVPSDTKPVSGGAVDTAISTAIATEVANRNTAIGSAYNTLRGVHSADITALLNAGGYIRLQAGSYTISSNVVLPEGTIVEGDNPNTTVINCSSVTGYAITMSSYCQLKNLKLVGDQTVLPSAVGSKHGIAIGTASTASDDCLISNVKVYGFSGHGIHGIKSNGLYWYRHTNRIINTETEVCGAGIVFSLYFQYAQVTNSTFSYCYIGGAVHDGNNMFTGCQFNANTIGLNMNGAESPNWNAHGVFSGCQFNHNTNAFYIENVTAGQIFTGCVVFYGSWLISNCQGIQFVGCELAWLNTETFSILNSTGMNTFADNYIVSQPASKTVTGVVPTMSNNKDVSNNEFSVGDNTPSVTAYGNTVVKRDSGGSVYSNYLNLSCAVETAPPNSGSFLFADDYGWLRKCSHQHLLKLLGFTTIVDTTPTAPNVAKNIALPAGWTPDTTFILSMRAWRTSQIIYSNSANDLVSLYFNNGNYIEVVLSQLAYDLGMAGQRLDILLVHL